MRNRRRYEFTSRPTRILFKAFYERSESEYLGSMGVFVVKTSRSLAFFCSFCGTIWGTRVDTGTIVWWVEARCCLMHGDGSLLTDTDPLEALPRRVLERELAIYKGGSDARRENNYPRD